MLKPPCQNLSAMAGQYPAVLDIIISKLPYSAMGVVANACSAGVEARSFGHYVVNAFFGNSVGVLPMKMAYNDGVSAVDDCDDGMPVLIFAHPDGVSAVDDSDDGMSAVDDSDDEMPALI